MQCYLQWNINTQSILACYLYPLLIKILRQLRKALFLECQNWLSYLYTFLLSYGKSKSEHWRSNASHGYFLHILHPCQLLNQCASFSQCSLMLLQRWCEQLKQLLEFCLNFSNNPSRNRKFAWSTIVILLFTSWVIPKPVNQMSSLLDGSTLLNTIAQNV